MAETLPGAVLEAEGGPCEPDNNGWMDIKCLPDYGDSFVDPCVLAYVPCRPETLKRNRVAVLEETIRNEAQEYGVDPDAAVRIAECESGLDERAQNPSSTAKGLYQFTDGTWEYVRAQGHQFDAEENVKQFLIWYPIHPEWWVCD